MNKVKIVVNTLFLVLAFSFALYSGEPQADYIREKKIFLVKFVQTSGDSSLKYFEQALPRSISTVIGKKLKITYNDKMPLKTKLKKQGFTHYITGKYTITNKSLLVQFSIYSLKSGKEMVRAIAHGFPDPRIFSLVDNVSGLAGKIVINPPAGTLFKTVHFEIDKKGKVTTKSVKLSRQQIKEIIRKVDLRGANLQGLNLSNMNLSKLNLKGAILRESNLVNADLRGANLAGVDMSRSNSENANLSQVNMTGTNLSHANLTNSDLTGVNLVNANLRYTNLTGADLSEVNLTGADLSFANCTDANFRRAMLNNVKLVGTNFTGADLSFTDLLGVDFSKCKINKAYFYSSYFNKPKIMKLSDGDVWLAPKFLFGINAGFGMSFHHTRIAASNLKIKVKPDLSFTVSARGMYFFKEWFGLLFDAGWQYYRIKEELIEGYNVVTGVSYPPTETIKLSFNYITFGVAPVFRIIRRIYLFIGPYVGLNISKSSIYFEKKKLSFGFFTGAGYKFRLSRKIFLITGIEFKMQIVKWGDKIIYDPSRILGIYGKVTLLFGVK